MIQNLKTISGISFFIIGSIYAISMLFVKNGIFSPICQLTLRIIDMPLAFIGLIFGGISLRESLKENGVSSSIIDNIIVAAGVILFLAVVYINFIYPDVA